MTLNFDLRTYRPSSCMAREYNVEIVGERYGVPTEIASASTAMAYFTDAKRKSYSAGLFTVFPKDSKKD